MSGPLKIAVAGLGTVGAGLLRLVRENGALLERRCGRAVAVTAVSARDRAKHRDLPLGGAAWFDDPVAMAREADADVVVELVGGADEPARQICEAAFVAGRHVVTANKALIAHHGMALAAAMQNRGLVVAADVSAARLEAAVKRLRRAGASNVERRLIEPGAKWLKRAAGGFDRVLVDAPCTGTGTWRRKPDARLRLAEADLLDLTQKQAVILERAAGLVKPGGILERAIAELAGPTQPDAAVGQRRAGFLRLFS